MKVMKVKLSQLIKDYSIYPRVEIDMSNVNRIAQAIELGRTIKRIVICRKTFRVIDGYHRMTAYARVLGENAEIEVEAKDYAKEGDLFKDSVLYNAEHGKSLSTFDRVRCLARAKAFKISIQEMADILRIKLDKATKLLESRTSRNVDGEVVPIKRTISQKAGEVLTESQIEANGKLSGMSPMFTINQLVILLENNLLPMDDESLWDRLDHLSLLIQESRPALATA